MTRRGLFAALAGIAVAQRSPAVTFQRWPIARMFREPRGGRFLPDPWEAPILKYLEGHDGVALNSLLVYPCGLDLNFVKGCDRKRVVSILRIAGWQRSRVWVSANNRAWMLTRPETKGVAA